MSQASTKKRKPDLFGEIHTPSEKQHNQATTAEDAEPSSDPSTLVSDEVPFTLECPARKIAKKRRRNGDVIGPKQEDGGFPTLKINYAIRPGKAWTDLKTHPSLFIGEHEISTRSLVYINRHVPAPDPPDTNASKANILAFDKEKLWVGQVLEVKAASPDEVWLRLFWLYWPDELPQGRQKYHGSQELVMSNHMEIVDVGTITSKAEISHWDETDDDQDVGHRFWRQFYDVRLEKTKSGGLSEIRRYCVCNEYYNPDEMMLKCPNAKCGIWNHQVCLEQAILAQTYGRLVGGQKSVGEPSKSFPAPRMDPLKAGKDVGIKQRNGQKRKSTTAQSPPSKNSTPQPAPWQGLPKAEISVGERGAGRALVTITDERADPKVWTESIQCLICGTSID